MKSRHSNKCFTVLLACLALAGCATTPAPSEDEQQAVASVPPAAETEPEIAYRPFPEDALFELLVAEFALQRKRYDVSLAYYMKQALKTRDAGIAAHSWRLARHLRADRAALEMAKLWVELEPDSVAARFNLAAELARADEPFEALAQMKVVLDRNGRTNFAGIAQATLKRPTDEQRVMLQDVASLVERNPADSDLLMAQALLQQGVGQMDAALVSLRQLLKVEPQQMQAIILEAGVLSALGKGDEAFQRIDTILAENPKEAHLRLQYARMLAKIDMRRAEEQFEILAQQHPDDGELLLALAMVYQENGKYEAMRERLEHLLTLGQQQDSAHYYLAVDAERREEVEAAIAHYFAVEPGKMFAAAVGRAATLLAEAGRLDEARSRLDQLRQGHPEQATRLTLLEADLLREHDRLEDARDLLSQALEASPENTSLLYARSMIYERLRDIPGLERDLREMLRLEPDSSLALNALGYTLTNLTDRHEEALVLISRALELKPNDPAILDSMGWVHYRLGNFDVALEYLQQAIVLLPDPEVAAHLGEVLWTLGRQEEARDVWRQALQQVPDSAIVLETIVRLAGHDLDLSASAVGDDTPEP